MVLLDNNFDSCVKAILHGRNIYANIKHFLQFQITVNFSILVIIFIGVIFLTESSFNALMLIWVNLVMDVLGAFALGTTAPLPSAIYEPAINNGTDILSKVLWHQIYGITIWNIVVMFIVIVLSHSIFNLEYELTDNASNTPAK